MRIALDKRPAESGAAQHGVAPLCATKIRPKWPLSFGELTVTHVSGLFVTPLPVAQPVVTGVKQRKVFRIST